MHITSEDIIKLLDDRLEAPKKDHVAQHLAQCEFCQELRDQIVLTSEKYKAFLKEDYSDELSTLMKRISTHSETTHVINLQRLTTIDEEEIPHLAADGLQHDTPHLQILSTFISEDPEIIVKLMKDNEKNEQYLLVLSEDENNRANVLVEIPALDKHYVTGFDGKAIINEPDLTVLSKEKWQVKLPDAVFDLEHFDYDPNRTEETSEVILTTEHNDKIKVIFEDRTEGKHINIQLLELNGSTDISDIKISLIQEDSVYIEKVNSHSVASFDLKDGSSGINIRIFS